MNFPPTIEDLEAIKLGSLYRHFAYGLAHVVATSTHYGTGEYLVTVKWTGTPPDGNIIPSRVTTYPLADFDQRFEVVAP